MYQVGMKLFSIGLYCLSLNLWHFSFKLYTRNYSNRMHTARSPTVHALVASHQMSGLVGALYSEVLK